MQSDLYIDPYAQTVLVLCTAYIYVRARARVNAMRAAKLWRLCLGLAALFAPPWSATSAEAPRPGRRKASLVANMSDDYLLTRAEIAAFKYGAHPVSL